MGDFFYVLKKVVETMFDRTTIFVTLMWTGIYVIAFFASEVRGRLGRAKKV